MVTHKRHIFLSYRSIEAEFALKLATDLRNNGIPIWMDILDGIHAAEDWRNSIEEGLSNAIALIAVLSPQYILSKYCLRELATADELDCPIIPIQIQEIPTEDRPIEVRRLQYIDFSDWQHIEAYQNQFDSLKSVIYALPKMEGIVKPDAEIQYLNSLTADLSARLGVLQYAGLSGNTEIDSPEAEYRNAYIGRDDEFGFSALILQNQAESTKPNRIVEVGGLESLCKKYEKFVLIGPPGSSKTTTIRNLALNAAQNRSQNPSKPLPLLFYLPMWTKQISIREFIRSQWKLAGLPDHIDPVMLLATGNASLFLDGLNEMGSDSSNKAKQIKDWLSGNDGPKYVIVTCRVTDYKDLNLEIPIVQIEPMNEEQIKRFVQNYLGEKSAQFFDRVYSRNSESKNNLVHLLENPYMLTALITIFDSSEGQEQLPYHNGKVLERLTNALGKREIRRKSVHSEFFQQDFELIKLSLAKLAFSMIDQGLPTSISLDQALRFFDNQHLLRACQNASYIEVVANKVRFSHQLLQEYFAAIHLVGILDGRTNAVSTISEKFVQSGRWDNVVVLLCTLIPASVAVFLLQLLIMHPHYVGVVSECFLSGIDLADIQNSEHLNIIREILVYNLGSWLQPIREKAMEGLCLLANERTIASLGRILNSQSQDMDEFQFRRQSSPYAMRISTILLQEYAAKCLECIASPIALTVLDRWQQTQKERLHQQISQAAALRVDNKRTVVAILGECTFGVDKKKESVASMLEIAKCTLIGFSVNARDGIVLARSLHPDIVWIDSIRLPDLDYLETIEILAQENPAITIVLSTGGTIDCNEVFAKGAKYVFNIEGCSQFRDFVMEFRTG